ncbi:MAG: DUF1501 domain-containing protein, partial [Planctomycetota bacterium]|nr:DUF1501 domain-containing protein [Planctomycetota bacterium]
MLTRRNFLQSLGGGFGSVALWDILAQNGALADVPRADLNGGLHHPAKVKRVIQLFMNGGASQCDLFDYKPALEKRHGQKFDPGKGERVEASTSEPGTILKPFKPIRQHGECGRFVSDLLPHLAKHVDELAFFSAMQGRSSVHGPSSYLMNTGFLLPGFPSMGSWISYALGSLTDNLPTFVALPDRRGLPYNQKGNFTSGFLSVEHQASIVNTAGDEPFSHLRAAGNAKFVTPESNRAGLELL